MRVSGSHPALFDEYCELIRDHGKGTATHCHVAFKCHPEERQRQHSNNIAAKGGMNLW
jgi:hypothetical protein